MKTNKKQDKLENKEIEEESTDEETHLKEFITNEANLQKKIKEIIIVMKITAIIINNQPKKIFA